MNLLSAFEQNVKIAPWLQFVGLALASIALGLIVTQGPVQHLYKVTGLVGCFVSFAGFIYKKIYP